MIGLVVVGRRLSDTTVSRANGDVMRRIRSWAKRSVHQDGEFKF